MFAPRARSPRALSAVLGTVIVLLIGVWLGGHPGWIPAGVRGVFVQNSEGQFVQNTLGLITRDYYRKVNLSGLVDQGLAGAVASLEDPYSHYYGPSTYAAFQNVTNPHLSGIGVDVLANPKGLLISDVLPNSPALRGGLAIGDVIAAVGSTSLTGRSATFASGLIKGRVGTRVSLTVIRGRSRRTVRLTRASVVVPATSAQLLHYRAKKLGWLMFTKFTSGSADQLRTQVKQMLAQGAQGLILDLRDNGGGLLDEAIKVASIFIPDGTIVSTRGRTVGNQVYAARGHAISTAIPLVVLVNRRTASSAEIVTGALKDRGRAKVVGTDTYGKGVFQEIQSLPGGSALEITVGEYFTPNGQNLGAGGVKQGPGITPTVYAGDDPRASVDRQLSVAESTLAAGIR